ncbi:hypothetical protein G9A89_022816 [Geosiphon pyriformis]|nr:hypothetical protein G9A89_022816 [Geosiphon pyriformis]
MIGLLLSTFCSQNSQNSIMVSNNSNNNISSPSNKSSISSEDSEIPTPQNSNSPETRNSVPPSSPPPRNSNVTKKFAGKDILPPQQTDQNPARFLAGCSKLDLEPNPFEQSFSHVTPLPDSETNNSPKPSLPPVASITSPSAGIPPSQDQYGWNLHTLRSGPLSPSMLEGPQNPIVFDDLQPNGRASTTNMGYNTFSETSPRSMGLYGNGNMSSTMINSASIPVINMGPLDPFGRNVFTTQGVPRPLTDSERNKIASNPATVAASTNSNSSVSQQGGVPSTISVIPSSVTGSALMNMGTGATKTTSNTNLMVANPVPNQSVMFSNTTIANRGILSVAQQMQESQHRTISDAVVPKTENDDLVSLENNHNLFLSRNGGYSNAMSGSVSVAASTSTASSDDGYEDESYDNLDSHIDSHKVSNPSTPSSSRSRRRKAEDNLSDQPPSKKSNQQQKVKNDLTDEEKRRNFLERNRQAALKCRQRKKQWLANLQNKVEYLVQDNERLENQATALREEILNLKTLLLAHKDCPISTQANGVMGLDTIHGVAGMSGMNVGPNGVSMGVSVGMVANGMQSGGNMSVQGPMPIGLSSVSSHIPNQINGQQASGMMPASDICFGIHKAIIIPLTNRRLYLVLHSFALLNNRKSRHVVIQFGEISHWFINQRINRITRERDANAAVNIALLGASITLSFDHQPPPPFRRDANHARYNLANELLFIQDE